MKIYEAYEDETKTYYIVAHNETEARNVVKLETDLESQDCFIDEIEVYKPRVIAFTSFQTKLS